MKKSITQLTEEWKQAHGGRPKHTIQGFTREEAEQEFAKVVHRLNVNRFEHSDDKVKLLETMHAELEQALDESVGIVADA